MTCDETTTARMRVALGALGHELVERRMMGGVCFMLDGNMLGGAHREKTGERYFMFRVGPELSDWAASQPDARPVQMGDRRQMRGFAFVDADGCNDRRLQVWLKKALSFAESLPQRS